MDYVTLRNMQDQFEKEVAIPLEASKVEHRIRDVALGWIMAKGVELQYAKGFAHDAYLMAQYRK